MIGTYSRAPRGAVRRWARRLGLVLDGADNATWDLAASRLAVRRRAAVLFAPVFLAAIVLAVFGLDRVSTGDSGRSGDATPLWPLIAGLVVTVGLIAWRETVRLGDLRLGRILTRRYARTASSGLGEIVGHPALVGLGLAAVLTPAMAGVLFVRDTATAAAAFTVAGAAAWSCAGVGLARARSRPTIAFDPLTLTLDDRLRTAEACGACTPVQFVTLSFTWVVAPSGSAGLYVGGLAAAGVLNILLALGRPGDRWIGFAPSSGLYDRPAEPGGRR